MKTPKHIFIYYDMERIPIHLRTNGTFVSFAVSVPASPKREKFWLMVLSDPSCIFHDQVMTVRSKQRHLNTHYAKI